MAAEDDLVPRHLREARSRLSTRGSGMEAVQRRMDTIQRRIEGIQTSVAGAVLRARIELLEKS